MSDRPDLIRAAGEGDCASCGEEIPEGALIAVEHGGLWICAACVDDEHGDAEALHAIIPSPRKEGPHA